MKRDIQWDEESARLRAALTDNDGAFIVAVDANGKANPMTIGWGQVGVVWSRPMFTALVRLSRYTYECLQSSNTFTINVPRPGELKDELILCGTKSGRDLDKVLECGLTLVPGKAIETPIIEQCALHYECRIVARTQQERSDFDSDEVLRQYYANGDHHLIVFGEIVAAYAAE
jgi:flavin reductase (DIM6/NTAB) family NADH-FMN oxidoreductase RutF